MIKGIVGEALGNQLQAWFLRSFCFFSLLGLMPLASGQPFCFDKIKAKGLKASEVQLSVLGSDFDPFDHVNSSRYLNWVTSAITQSCHDQGLESKSCSVINRLVASDFDITFAWPITKLGNIKVSIEKPVLSNMERTALIGFRISDAQTNRSYAFGSITFSNRFMIFSQQFYHSAEDLPKVAIPGYGVPVVYEDTEGVQWQQLGPMAGELHPGGYVSLFVANRWNQSIARFDADPIYFRNFQTGFAIGNLKMSVLLPITGLGNVVTRSWVTSVENGGRELVIHFETLSGQTDVPGEETVHASGDVRLMVRSTMTGKAKELPFEFRRLFFEPQTK